MVLWLNEGQGLQSASEASRTHLPMVDPIKNFKVVPGLAAGEMTHLGAYVG